METQATRNGTKGASDDRTKDVKGLRSGHLVAIEKTEEKRHGSFLWRCQCDCGREVLVEAYRLRAGRTRSCGCARKGKGIKEITGQSFGRLTALYRLEEKRGSSYLWHCLCRCGNETDVPVNALLFGKSTSCGCARKEALQNRAKDIRGKAFGRLTVLGPAERKCHGGKLWRCRCTCGNECEATYSMLMNGNTTSCGCKKREHLQPQLHYVDGTCIEMITRKNRRSDNSSGFTGVSAVRGGKWKAEITFKKKRYYLGTYTDYEYAVEVRKKAEQRLFGEFLDTYRNEKKAGNSA